VTITADARITSQEDGSCHAAKVPLISMLVLLLQSGRLKFAQALPETAILCRELENYQPGGDVQRPRRGS
jgi:hypothetical protein